MRRPRRAAQNLYRRSVGDEPRPHRRPVAAGSSARRGVSSVRLGLPRI